MVFLKQLAASFLILPTWASSPQIPLSAPTTSDNKPNLEQARLNANHVFNALHGSMRQWDSSLNHNGMSFFPASIPNNTLLYHGTHTEEPVKGMEWLAFEIEHAENFARSRRGRPPGGGPGGRPNHPPGQGPPPHVEDEPDSHGFLHIYRTTRHFTRLLYIDGMSAAKSSLGTLDSQDYVLLNASSEPRITAPFGDFQRAQDMCTLGAEHGIEGIIRMEAGFELILCNFTNGLELVSAYQRPDYNKPEGYNDLWQFEYVRGVAARYGGITNNRVEVDFSHMVSAYFYPMNISNPRPDRPTLPRFVSSSPEDLVQLKSNILELFSEDREASKPGIDWQGITDMIVTRYSDRLQFMATGQLSNKTLLSEIGFLVNAYVDYKTPSIPLAIEKCTHHYLASAIPQTLCDQLIFESIASVSRKICSTLFEVRSILLEHEPTIEDVNPAIEALIEYLDWSAWLECGKCEYNEVCFVAIWPWGAVEDHEKPSCLNPEKIQSRRGYWDWAN